MLRVLNRKINRASLRRKIYNVYEPHFVIHKYVNAYNPQFLMRKFLHDFKEIDYSKIGDDDIIQLHKTNILTGLDSYVINWDHYMLNYIPDAKENIRRIKNDHNVWYNYWLRNWNSIDIDGLEKVTPPHIQWYLDKLKEYDHLGIVVHGDYGLNAILPKQYTVQV